MQNKFLREEQESNIKFFKKDKKEVPWQLRKPTEEELNECWKWYKENVHKFDIVEKRQYLETELVELTGRYAGKLVIKIPVDKDDREGKFKQLLSSYYGIDIRKWIFHSEFSSPDKNGRRYRRLYNVYLFKYKEENYV